MTVCYATGNYDVKINILGQGSVEGSGAYPANTKITLVATPQSGYQFVGWSGDLAGKDSTISFSLASPITANAHFEPISNDIIYVNGHPAIAGSFLAKLNETGRRRLQRRVNRVGDTLVYRRNKVLDDLVSIEWDNELKLKDNLTGEDLTNEEIRKLAEKRSALKSQGVESQLKEMLNSGNYDYVEPNWQISANAEPNDFYYKQGHLWGLKNSKEDIDANLEDAWDLTTGSNEVVVAVIDSGIRYTHEDLRVNMWKNPDEVPGNGIDDDGNFIVDDVYGMNAIGSYSDRGEPSGDPVDDHGHGTHCAGTIGAQANGGGVIVGVAWNVKLMALKFLNSECKGSMRDSIACIDYAIANGAHVINASYGCPVFIRSEYEAIERAQEAGIVFVAAAGNDKKDNDLTPSYPNSYDLENIISVSAIDRGGNLADFSNFGLKSADLGAPGVRILSSHHTEDDSYVFRNGTSMAAPHVAGAAALILSREPDLSPTQVRQRLLDTAKPLDSLVGKTVSGAMLDVHAALEAKPKSTLSMEVTHIPEIPDKDGPFKIIVRLTSPQPVLGASVQATLGESYNLFDNGFNGDEEANDGIYSANVFAPNLLSFEMPISASSSGFETTTKTLPIKTIFRPSNDTFADALPLSNSNDLTIGDNTGATLEEQEPLFTGGITGTMWYRWRPSLSGDATLSTFGSSFDTTLAVYTGSSLANLERIVSNDDFSEQQFTSKVEFSASKEESYWIQVGGVQGKTGEFTIHHPEPTKPPPPAPKIDPPVILTEPTDLSKIEGGSMSISVSAVGTLPLKYQWSLNGGKITDANQSSFSLPLISVEDSGQYSVVVSNPAGSASLDVANLKVRASQNPPLNDNIENAALFQGESGNGLAITRLATGQPNEPDHAGASYPLHSVWWKWVAPKSGEVVVSTAGSSFDTTLAAYQLSDSDTTRRSSRLGKKIAFVPATAQKDMLITLPGHGFTDGQEVEISGLVGHPSETAKFLISRIDGDSFSLSGTAGLSNLSLSPSSRVASLK